jgi:hypothetical protein
MSCSSPSPRAARSRRRRQFFLPVGLLVTACAALLTVAVNGHSAGASPARPNVMLPTSGMIFGAAVGSNPDENDTRAVAVFEDELGRTLGLDRSFSSWDATEPSYAIKDDVKFGRLPFVTIQPQLSNGQKITWYGITSGAHDARIYAQARALKSVGHPILLSLDHEMNLRSGWGSAADYAAAMRHYVDIFRAVGATNVSFAFVLSASGYLNNGANAWYPGDSYVDWIGADTYNFAQCQPNIGLPHWRTLATTGQPFYDWAGKRGKPLVIAEWGTTNDPKNPQAKAQWISDAVKTLQGWPKVKAAAYFEADATCDWRVTSDAASLSAFKTLAASPLANAMPTARLSVLSGQDAGFGTVVFKGSNSTGANHATGSGVASWSFDPGDGTATITGRGQPGTITHSYRVGGQHIATLHVLDGTGRAATTSLTLPVQR